MVSSHMIDYVSKKLGPPTNPKNSVIDLYNKFHHHLHLLTTSINNKIYTNPQPSRPLLQIHFQKSMLSSIRRIFSLFRTEEEEKKYSRRAFFNLLGFLFSCVLFSFVSQKLAKNPRELARAARILALNDALTH